MRFKWSVQEQRTNGSRGVDKQAQTVDNFVARSKDRISYISMEDFTSEAREHVLIHISTITLVRLQITLMKAT